MIETRPKLGDYTLGRKLGKGQYSTVREGLKEGKVYAAKYMKQDKDAALNQAHLDLVINEAKIMSQLEHPNLVKLYDFNDKGVLAKPAGKATPVLYLVFDLITGGELFDYVAVSGRFSDKMARYFFKQLIEALEYMHSKGFAHRDIKAENILLDENYGLKLADFGFSTPMAGKDGSGKLHTYKGTLGYMAPEIHMSQPYTGEKVDIFALGVLLFIMVGQHPPFRKALASDQYYKMLCQANETYWAKMSAGKPPGTFSPHLKSLLNSLLAFNPTLRPSIAEIKTHPWYNGPVLTPEELAAEFSKRRGKVELEWKSKAAEEFAKKQAKKAEEKKKKGSLGTPMGGFGAHPTTRAFEVEGKTASAAAKRFLSEYKVRNIQ